MFIPEESRQANLSLQHYDRAADPQDPQKPTCPAWSLEIFGKALLVHAAMGNQVLSRPKPAQAAHGHLQMLRRTIDI